MHTKKSIKDQIMNFGIQPDDTLLIDSSMKAIGEVKNRGDNAARQAAIYSMNANANCVAITG